MAFPPNGRSRPLCGRNIWLPAFMSMFPEVLTRTYCVPPIHFNRLPYHTHPMGGLTALVLPSPDGDTAQKHEKKPDSHAYPAAAFSHVEVHCLPLKNNPSPSTRKKKTKLEGQRCKQPTRPVWSSECIPTDVTPVSVFPSDLRDDFAQQHVLTHLLELGHQRGEVMFILSQMVFSDYLNQPSYAAAAAQFPRPQDLGRKYRHGEFDIVLIHRHYGILIGELKSVGIWQANFIQTPAEVDANVAKRVKTAVKQLERSGRVIDYLVSDILCGVQLTIRKTIFLPYVSQAQLQRIVDHDPDLNQELCRSLGAVTSAEAVRLCVCSDVLSLPQTYWNITPAVLSRFSNWWQQRMTPTNTQLNESLYLEIVSRFVGPASSKTVHCVFPPPQEIKTDWQAISYLGWRLARLVLTPQQIDLLNRAPPRICVTGPPGTGKTIVLVLMGLQWLLQGRDVHVISVFYKSLAASQLVKYQLKMTLRAHGMPPRAAGKIHFHQYNFWDVEDDVLRAVRELTAAAANKGELYVLMDEAWFGYQGLEASYHKLFTEMSEQVPFSHWWAADVGHINIPEQLVEERLTVPLRYTSAVLREVEEGIALYNTVHGYTASGLPSLADGPPVIHLHHRGVGHEEKWPVLCFRCGQEVAGVLFRLGVGRKGTQSTNSPPPLQYRDVFVLTRSSELQDEVADGQGSTPSKVCPFVQGLRASRVPVCVLNGTIEDAVKWEQDLADVAVGESDWVTAAHLGATNGLERKVVVWLPGRMKTGDQQYTEEAIEALDRLASMSRCTTQLIMVNVPSDSPR